MDAGLADRHEPGLEATTLAEQVWAWHRKVSHERRQTTMNATTGLVHNAAFDRKSPSAAQGTGTSGFPATRLARRRSQQTRWVLSGAGHGGLPTIMVAPASVTGGCSNQFIKLRRELRRVKTT